jgi:hypoxanthine phosphoribosyltransferase
VGTISSTLHRDDFGERGLGGVEAATSLPFEIDGARILLIDDVIASGRTIRAVVNELFDYGRPASVELAVMVDRGGRELPDLRRVRRRQAHAARHPAPVARARDRRPLHLRRQGDHLMLARRNPQLNATAS